MRDVLGRRALEFPFLPAFLCKAAGNPCNTECSWSSTLLQGSPPPPTEVEKQPQTSLFPCNRIYVSVISLNSSFTLSWITNANFQQWFPTGLIQYSLSFTAELCFIIFQVVQEITVKLPGHSSPPGNFTVSSTWAQSFQESSLAPV